MEEDLKKLGLSWNETKVYLSLVKIGETPVGGIINDLKVHRQIIYNALDELEKRNMVIKTLRNKVNHYKIADPEIIVDNIKQQELIASRLSRRIQEELKTEKKEQEINVIQGKENIRRYFINKYKEMPISSTLYLMHTEAKKFQEVMGEEFLLKTYDKLRAGRKIHSKNLTSENYREEIEKYNKNLNQEFRENRYLPYELSNPVSTSIWEDSIHLQSFQGKTPFIIEIKNKELRDSYMGHFNFLWEIAKE